METTVGVGSAFVDPYPGYDDDDDDDDYGHGVMVRKIVDIFMTILWYDNHQPLSPSFAVQCRLEHND